MTRGLDIGFFPLGSIPLTHCCYNIVDTPFTKTVLDFSRKISKEKNDILLDLQTSDKNTHQYIFSKIKMYDFFHILVFPYIKKEHSMMYGVLKAKLILDFKHILIKNCVFCFFIWLRAYYCYLHRPFCEWDKLFTQKFHILSVKSEIKNFFET